LNCVIKTFRGDSILAYPNYQTFRMFLILADTR
jgi:hypothetical protein